MRKSEGLEYSKKNIHEYKVDRGHMQQTLFNLTEKTVETISNPEAYKGISSFHKYWGKKPTESIAYFIQKHTNENDIVVDPFLGSGLISRECLAQNRRFIGIDINPFSIEHSNFLVDPPHSLEYQNAFDIIEHKVKEKINETYSMQDRNIATHYLWNGDELIKVWTKLKTSKNRIEASPVIHDLDLIKRFSNYEVKNIRSPSFFTNSRINSSKHTTIYDLFTRRALYCIDLILDEIYKFPKVIQRSLLLTLTASSGQMSSMVFAISNRGKTKNLKSEKIEVGSWVIGFWRPKLHFEINVWNCFESRAKKLYKALQEIDGTNYTSHSSLDSLYQNKNGACILEGDCLEAMRSLPPKSIKLICTDPPHGDRIPYLELSEMWNSILNKNVSFEKEIIISNAKERNKNKSNYIELMKSFIEESSRILLDDGMLLIYFNARDKESWKFFDILKSNSEIQFIGAFPMEYSANSVVQDNRKGGMKTDFVLVMKKVSLNINFKHELHKIPGWSNVLPEKILVA